MYGADMTVCNHGMEIHHSRSVCCGLSAAAERGQAAKLAWSLTGAEMVIVQAEMAIEWLHMVASPSPVGT